MCRFAWTAGDVGKCLANKNAALQWLGIAGLILFDRLCLWSGSTLHQSSAVSFKPWHWKEDAVAFLVVVDVFFILAKRQSVDNRPGIAKPEARVHMSTSMFANTWPPSPLQRFLERNRSACLPQPWGVVFPSRPVGREDEANLQWPGVSIASAATEYLEQLAGSDWHTTYLTSVRFSVA
jgi:hypothetical protein